MNSAQADRSYMFCKVHPCSFTTGCVYKRLTFSNCEGNIYHHVHSQLQLVSITNLRAKNQHHLQCIYTTGKKVCNRCISPQGNRKTHLINHREKAVDVELFGETSGSLKNFITSSIRGHLTGSSAVHMLTMCNTLSMLRYSSKGNSKTT